MVSDDLRTTRRLLTSAIVALVLGAVLSMLDDVIATAWGAIAAVGSMAVTWLCSWRASRFMKAGASYYLWKYLPAVLLVALPVVLRLVWRFRREESGFGSGPMELVSWARPLLAFVVPLILLLLADWSLRRLSARLDSGA